MHFSQSNARVSAYLQALEEIVLFVGPELQYVRAAENPETRVESYEYSIQLSLDNTPEVNMGEGEGEDQAGAG